MPLRLDLNPIFLSVIIRSNVGFAGCMTARVCTTLARSAAKCEKIPLANRISFKNPSTDELSTYILASHGFIIGLRRLKPTFLKRTRDFLSENINKNASIRIRGALDAIKGQKRPLSNRISFKSPMRGPKISSGLPGASRANGWA